MILKKIQMLLLLRFLMKDMNLIDGKKFKNWIYLYNINYMGQLFGSYNYYIKKR
jgi:hypothetical protein